MKRSRFQFSLLTLLLLVTIVCLSAALWVMCRNLRETQAENQEFRDRFGYLTISDPKKIHVIRIPNHEEDAWRWRVYLPEGHQYQVCFQVGKIPRGLPADLSSDHSMPLAPGEHTLFASLSSELHGNPVFHVRDFGNRMMGTALVGEKGDWLDDYTGGTLTGVLQGGTSVFETSDNPKILLRLQVSESVASTGQLVGKQGGSKPRSARGVVVWIETIDAPKTSKQKAASTP
jgi:hypothetical protein